MGAYNAHMVALQNAFEQTPDGPIKGQLAKESFEWVKDLNIRCGLDAKIDAAPDQPSNTELCLLNAFNSRSVHLKSLYLGQAPN